MVNLPLFIRMVREAQGVQQAELAKKMGVSQSAVTQFEKMKSTLSTDTVVKASSVLNLNPDFIQMGTGNPFKPSSPKKTIKFFLAEDPLGKIDFSLVEEVARANKRAVFYFLKPILFKSEQIPIKDEATNKTFRQWIKHREQDVLIYALFVQDEDGNMFLFKRRNNLLFSEQTLVLNLHNLEIKNNKYFETEVVTIGSSACQMIRGWSDISIKDIVKEIFVSKYHRNRAFIHRLTGEVWVHKSLLTDRKRYEKIKMSIDKMDDSKLDHLLSQLVPEIAKVISARVLSM